MGPVAALVADHAAAKGRPAGVVGVSMGPPPPKVAAFGCGLKGIHKPVAVVVPEGFPVQCASTQNLAAEVVMHSGPLKARMPRSQRSPVWTHTGGLFELVEDPVGPGPMRAKCVECGWHTAHKDSGGTNKLRRHMERVHKRALKDELPASITAAVKAALAAIGQGSFAVYGD